MKTELISILDNISKLLEINGESFFKFSSYSNAAETLRMGDYDIIQLVKDNQLSEIKGFGKALTEKITDYVTNGKMSYYENLITELPVSLIEILKIDGMGPKKVNQVYSELGIKNIEELRIACIEGKIEELKGFSKKTVANILDSINLFMQFNNYKERGIDFDKIQ
jgi:DNA polymerase (family 10)